MGKRDFCELYEYGSSNKDTSGTLKAYSALGTMLNARNARGSKTGLLFHVCMNFFAVLALGESLCELQNGLKWS